jgi:hypothetical protein
MPVLRTASLESRTRHERRRAPGHGRSDAIEAAALAAALAESALGSESEEHKAGPWEFTPSHLDGLDDICDPDAPGSEEDFNTSTTRTTTGSTSDAPPPPLSPPGGDTLMRSHECSRCSHECCCKGAAAAAAARTLPPRSMARCRHELRILHSIERSI